MRRVTVVLMLVLLLCAPLGARAQRPIAQFADVRVYDLDWFREVACGWGVRMPYPNELVWQGDAMLNEEQVATLERLQVGDVGWWYLPRWPWGSQLWQGRLIEIQLGEEPYLIMPPLRSGPLCERVMLRIQLDYPAW